MSVDPKRIPGQGVEKPLLKSDVEAAQRYTNSHHAAAAYCKRSYKTYMRYAKAYGLWENHKNQAGRGITKKKKKGLFGLNDILAGNHPTYDTGKLKERLIQASIFPNECALCGYNKSRLDGRVPLVLYFKDDDSHNHRKENLELRCYNCTYITTGKISKASMERMAIQNQGVYDGDAEEILSSDELAELQEKIYEKS